MQRTLNLMYISGWLWRSASLARNRVVIIGRILFGGTDCLSQQRNGRRMVGWVFANHLVRRKRAFAHLRDSLKMRVANIALWINKNSDTFYNCLYDPDQRYDVVIFFKAMNSRDRQEAEKIKGYGGKVIFDANVNYYEIWGEFKEFSNVTTSSQQEAAASMTRLADMCVGDSTRICEVAAQKYNATTRWVPDNVDLATFRYVRHHGPVPIVRLVWSGISFKAGHLLLLTDVFPRLVDMELVLVSEKRPEVMDRLKTLIKCRYVPYSDEGYARLLAQCDIIISPKNLINSYEIGHSEYKITLGMAAGLPAVASPQQSYVEAISAFGGGIIAESSDDWLNALSALGKDHKLRAEIGDRARRTVVSRYSTQVVANQYSKVIEECLAL